MTVTQILCVKSIILGFPNSPRVVLHTCWQLGMVPGSPGAAPEGTLPPVSLGGAAAAPLAGACPRPWQ